MDDSIHPPIGQAPESVAAYAMTRNVPHCEAVNTLTWAVLATHPIIAFAGTSAPLFTAKPEPALLEAIKQTSRHLLFTHGEATSLLKGSANANDSTAKD
jgi:hypothetical protein